MNFDPNDLPGLKQDEIRPCIQCGKPLCADRQLTFYDVQIRRLVVDLSAVQRQHGLELLVGSPKIAAVMGPNEDIAKEFARVRVFVFQKCAGYSDMCLAQLVEAASVEISEGESGGEP